MINSANPRIVKKLSVKAKDYFKGLPIEYSHASSVCTEYGKLVVGTPIVRFAVHDCGEPEIVCLWSLLKSFFVNTQARFVYSGEQWLWGKKPTPENVMTWAYWEQDSIDKLIPTLPILYVKADLYE